MLTTDYETVSTFARNGLQQLFGAVALPLFVFLGLLTVDAAMAGAVAVSVLAAVPLFWWTNRFFRAAALDRGDRLAAAVGRMTEYVQGIGVIRAFDRTRDRLGWCASAVAVDDTFLRYVRGRRCDRPSWWRAACWSRSACSRCGASTAVPGTSPSPAGTIAARPPPCCCSCRCWRSS